MVRLGSPFSCLESRIQKAHQNGELVESVVAQVHSNWNNLRAELARWKNLSGEVNLLSQDALLN